MWARFTLTRLNDEYLYEIRQRSYQRYHCIQSVWTFEGASWMYQNRFSQKNLTQFKNCCTLGLENAHQNINHYSSQVEKSWSIWPARRVIDDNNKSWTKGKTMSQQLKVPTVLSYIRQFWVVLLCDIWFLLDLISVVISVYD